MAITPLLLFIVPFFFEGDEGITLFQPYGPPPRASVSVLPCALSWAKIGGIVSTGRGSRVAAGSDYLDFQLDWLRCFVALSTYNDSAAAAAAGWSSRGSCTWVF